VFAAWRFGLDNFTARPTDSIFFNIPILGLSYHPKAKPGCFSKARLLFFSQKLDGSALCWR
jgi:hypothetical protein